MTGSTADAPFLDFRTLPAWCGDPAYFGGLPPGRTGVMRFLTPEGGLGTVRASRDADGTLTATAGPDGYEPVVEDGMLVGLRFPGCGLLPGQPHDPGQHGSTPDAGPEPHAARLAALAAAQRDSARELASAVTEATAAGMSWRAIGEALGLPASLVFRMHKAGSPVSVLRPYQSKLSPRAKGTA